MTTTQAWHDARRTGIGGSDVAALLGLSKWKTPLAVYLEKLGEAPAQEDNSAMQWGRYLEPVIRQAYADRTGREVRVPTTLLRSAEHDFMIANVDGLTEDRRIFEAKTARSGAEWGESGSDQIPQAYLLQVQHYMAVANFKVADVAVLIAGSDFRIYEVPADEALQAMLIDAEAEFWQRVQRREPPEPTSVADAVAKWTHSVDRSVTATLEAQQAVEALRWIREQRAALDIDEEAPKSVVLLEMGDAERLVDDAGKVLVTWKTGKGSKRLDAALLKAQMPDIYAEFAREGEPARRFLVK